MSTVNDNNFNPNLRIIKDETMTVFRYCEERVPPDTIIDIYNPWRRKYMRTTSNIVKSNPDRFNIKIGMELDNYGHIVLFTRK